MKNREKGKRQKKAAARHHVQSKYFVKANILTKQYDFLVVQSIFYTVKRLFYRLPDYKEIDFVASKNEQTIYLQVCYVMVDDNTHDREFGNLLKIEDNNPKYVISMDQFANSPYKGIFHWSIRKFLMEFE